MQDIKSFIIENNKDTSTLKQKLMDLLNNVDLDNEDLVKMYNIGKYSDKVLGYKSYDPKHAVVTAKMYRDNQVYRYVLRNDKTGKEDTVETSGNPYKGKSENVWKIISKEEVTFEKSDQLYHDNPMKDRLSNIDVDINAQKSIIRLLRDINMINKYYKYIENPTVSVNDFINGNNLANICNKKIGFNKNAFRLISTFQARDSKGTSLGNYEILLKLILKDYNNTTRLDGKGGDIIAGGVGIEIKGNGGRLIGQYKGNASKIKQTFYGVLGIDDKDDIVTKYPNPFSGIRCVKSLIEELVKKGYDNGKISEAVSEAIAFYYNDNNASDLQKFILKKWRDIEKNYGLIHRILGCYQIIKYQELEKWDYMAVFDEDRNSINGDYMIISKDDLSLDYLYNLSNIKFDKGIVAGSKRDKGNCHSSRDNAFGIEYKK